MEQTKIADFSRHHNVEEEIVVKQTTIFTSAPAEVTAEDKKKTNPWFLLYDKVGAYYHWSWEQFYNNTPYIVIKGLSELIDYKLENLEEGKFLRWDSVDTAIGIARCFGGESED